MTLKFFMDAMGTQEISQVSWKGSITITLVHGEKVTAHKLGNVATAVFYIINDSNNDFGVTDIVMPDKRIKYVIDSSWIYPNKPVKIELTFPIKDEIILQGNKIEIKGYYVIQG